MKAISAHSSLCTDLRRGNFFFTAPIQGSQPDPPLLTTRALEATTTHARNLGRMNLCVGDPVPFKQSVKDLLLLGQFLLRIWIPCCNRKAGKTEVGDRIVMMAGMMLTLWYLKWAKLSIMPPERKSASSLYGLASLCRLEDIRICVSRCFVCFYGQD